MALKAGYNGIKKSVLDKLLQMSGALIIKSLGTALSLSDAGELRVRNASESHSGVVQPDGETTFIEEGLLKAAASGFSLTTLFAGGYQNPASYNTDITVLGDKKILDYDLLLFSITSSQETSGGEGHIGTWQYIADPKILNTTDRNIITVFSDRLIFLSLTGDKTFRYRGEGGQLPYIMYIYGLKF